MYKRCDTCKFAEWDFVSAYGGGYYTVSGCCLPKNAPVTDESLIPITKLKSTLKGEYWSDEWGNNKNCPFWEEIQEEI